MLFPTFCAGRVCSLHLLLVQRGMPYVARAQGLCFRVATHPQSAAAGADPSLWLSAGMKAVCGGGRTLCGVSRGGAMQQEQHR